MPAFATLTANPTGHHMRISHHGFVFGSIAVAVQRGEEPTDAATHALAEHGWVPVEEWDAVQPDQWCTHIDLTEEN